MNIDEFRKRVSAFMTNEEIEGYAEDYEPVYMEAHGITKDEFCGASECDRALS